MQLPSFYEHSYSSGRSVYEAAISWAAGQLYMLTWKNEYLDVMTGHTDAMIACQEISGPLPGLFCRDETKKMLMHFNHQTASICTSTRLCSR